MPELSVRNEVCDINRPDIQRIKALLQSGTVGSCDRILDEVLDDVKFREIGSFMLRLYVCVDIFIAARDFARNIGITDDQFTARFGTVNEIENRMTDAIEMERFLRDTLRQCIVWRAGAARDSASGVVANAKEYINRNYMNYDISLKSVADAVGLSPAYLSALFKKEIGQNLSEYLTDVRIRRSKELLCCTSKMVYEVAYEVGFHDYKYFSQIFKKHTGQTPRQFQNSANVCP